MLADVLHKVAEFDREEEWVYSPRPSLAGPERCIRSLDYYAQDYERKPFPGRFITVLDDSSWHEQLIKDWIRKSAFQIHSEQMEVACGIVNGKSVRGHIDGILTDIILIDRLLEIKAISHFGFQDVWNGHLPLDYITQSCLYLKGLRETIPDLQEALLFIKNKNQSQYLEILISLDGSDCATLKEIILSTGERKPINQKIENVTGSALARFEEIERYRQEKKVHPRIYEKSHWRCQYCPYGELCWEGWEEEIENMVEGQADEEFETMCRYYKETSAHVSEMEKEKDNMNGQIKGYMKEHGWNKTVAGEYTALLDIRRKKALDQTLIPPAILAQAQKENAFEVLTVKRRKEKS